MNRGQEYLIGINQQPGIQPKLGGWATIRYANGHASVGVSIQDVTVTDWGRSMHIVALANGPDPIPGADEIVYRDADGEGESRVITRFTPL